LPSIDQHFESDPDRIAHGARPVNVKWRAA
jgi:hypothetical protein